MESLSVLTKNDLVEIVKRLYNTIDEKKEYLSKLDTEIGDGDHGFSMFSGFKSFYDKLDEFSERVQAERAIKYRLTRQSVYNAQKHGWNAAKIVEALVEMSQADNGSPAQENPSLPQNVVRTLQEWQALHERITIHRRAGLLQAADRELLARLAEAPQIGRHLLKSVDETDGKEAALAIISPALGEADLANCRRGRALIRSGEVGLTQRWRGRASPVTGRALARSGQAQPRQLVARAHRRGRALTRSG